MVTDEIRLRTRSVKEPEHVYEFVGKPDGTYSIRQVEDAGVSIGTAASGSTAAAGTAAKASENTLMSASSKAR